MSVEDNRYIKVSAAKLLFRVWSSDYAKEEVLLEKAIFEKLFELLNLKAKNELIRRANKALGKKWIKKLKQGDEVSSSLVFRISIAIDVKPGLRDMASDLIAQAIDAIPLDEVSKVEERLNGLGVMLGLSQAELGFISLLYLVESGQSMVDALSDSGWLETRRLTHYIDAAVNAPQEEAKELLVKGGRLESLKLIEPGGLSDAPKLASFVHESLHGLTREAPMARLFEVADHPGPDLAELNVDESHRATLRALLANKKGGANILLHGVPGTGKTSLAFALAKDLGLTVYRVKSCKDDAVEARVTALLCACEALKGRPDALVLVDEADQLLCTFYGWMLFGNKLDKGWLNTFLETTSSKVIWIANEIFGTESSTLRRFSFALEFKNLTTKGRLKVWQDAIRRTGVSREVLRPDDVDNLARTYKLNAGPISDALRAVASAGLPGDEARQMLHTLLGRFEETLEGDGARRRRLQNETGHEIGLEGLSMDHDPAQVLSALSQFSERRFGGESPKGLPRNLNLLLSGPPGCGKTEFAKYVARHLGRDLLTKRASDLLSPYIGMTEKNIAAAFEEAEKDQAVLFLDEADSLLTDRSGAHRSWEVSQTNELLGHMEAFGGILICATNFLDSLDSAAMRRFAFKVRFDYLKDTGKEIFLRRVLGDLVKVEGDGSQAIARLAKVGPLAPGDFKVARQKLMFLPPEKVTIDAALLALEGEAAARREARPIGFT